MRSRNKLKRLMDSGKKPRFASVPFYRRIRFAYSWPQARVTQAAEQRLAAQNEQHHWAKKLLDEEKKVRDAKEQLNVVQQEFEASYGLHLASRLLTLGFLGVDKRSRAVLRSLS
jgi:hypothetical protein